MCSFGITLVCVVLQATDGFGDGDPADGDPVAPQYRYWATEVVREYGYGVCQIVLTVAVLPLTVYVLHKNLLERDVKEQQTETVRSNGDEDEDDPGQYWEEIVALEEKKLKAETAEKAAKEQIEEAETTRKAAKEQIEELKKQIEELRVAGQKAAKKAEVGNDEETVNPMQ